MFAHDVMRRCGVVLTICAVSLSGAGFQTRAFAAPATVQSNLGTPLPPPSERFREGVEAYDRGDFETAFKIWLPLAQQSDLAAMRNVALLLREGKGTARDPVRALWFYEDAGAKGFALAQVNAAFMHLEGDGVPKNLEAAAFWFHAGARAGSPIAQYNLAVMYERGTGVEKDMPKALGWYALAARSGSTPALDRLALLVPALEGPKAPERTVLPDAAATSEAEQDVAIAPTPPPSDAAPLEEPQTGDYSLDMDDPARR